MVSVVGLELVRLDGERTNETGGDGADGRGDDGRCLNHCDVCV